MASCTSDLEDYSLALSDSDSETSDSDAEEECLEFSDVNLSLSATTLKEVLGTIQHDKSVVSCSLGESICQATQKCLLHITAPQMEQFAAIIVEDLKQMLGCHETKQRKLKLSTFWRRFHAFRLSPTVHQAWRSCATFLNIPDSIVALTLQVILKRVVMNIIHTVQTTTDSAQFVQADRLTEREENIARYMAGYVASKVQKKYPIYSQLVQFKKDTALNFTGDDMQDYSSIWSEQMTEVASTMSVTLFMISLWLSNTNAGSI